MSNSGQPEIIDLVSDSEPEEEEENGNNTPMTIDAHASESNSNNGGNNRHIPVVTKEESRLDGTEINKFEVPEDAQRNSVQQNAPQQNVAPPPPPPPPSSLTTGTGGVVSNNPALTTTTTTTTTTVTSSPSMNNETSRMTDVEMTNSRPSDADSTATNNNGNGFTQEERSSGTGDFGMYDESLDEDNAENNNDGTEDNGEDAEGWKALQTHEEYYDKKILNLVGVDDFNDDKDYYLHFNYLVGDVRKVKVSENGNDSLYLVKFRFSHTDGGTRAYVAQKTLTRTQIKRYHLDFKHMIARTNLYCSRLQEFLKKGIHEDDKNKKYYVEDPSNRKLLNKLIGKFDSKISKGRQHPYVSENKVGNLGRVGLKKLIEIYLDLTKKYLPLPLYRQLSDDDKMRYDKMNFGQWSPEQKRQSVEYIFDIANLSNRQIKNLGGTINIWANKFLKEFHVYVKDTYAQEDEEKEEELLLKADEIAQKEEIKLISPKTNIEILTLIRRHSSSSTANDAVEDNDTERLIKILERLLLCLKDYQQAVDEKTRSIGGDSDFGVAYTLQEYINLFIKELKTPGYKRVGLLGVNGAGKSHLLNMLLVLGEMPSSKYGKEDFEDTFKKVIKEICEESPKFEGNDDTTTRDDFISVVYNIYVNESAEDIDLENDAEPNADFAEVTSTTTTTTTTTSTTTSIIVEDFEKQKARSLAEKGFVVVKPMLDIYDSFYTIPDGEEMNEIENEKAAMDDLRDYFQTGRRDDIHKDHQYILPAGNQSGSTTNCGTRLRYHSQLCVAITYESISKVKDRIVKFFNNDPDPRSPHFIRYSVLLHAIRTGEVMDEKDVDSVLEDDYPKSVNEIEPSTALAKELLKFDNKTYIYQTKNEKLMEDRMYVRELLLKYTSANTASYFASGEVNPSMFIKSVIVWAPSEILKEWIEWIDFPGVNDKNAMRDNFLRVGLESVDQIIAISDKDLSSDEAVSEKIKEYGINRRIASMSPIALELVRDLRKALCQTDNNGSTASNENSKAFKQMKQLIDKLFQTRHFTSKVDEVEKQKIMNDARDILPEEIFGQLKEDIAKCIEQRQKLGNVSSEPVEISFYCSEEKSQQKSARSLKQANVLKNGSTSRVITHNNNRPEAVAEAIKQKTIKQYARDIQDTVNELKLSNIITTEKVKEMASDSTLFVRAYPTLYTSLMRSKNMNNLEEHRDAQNLSGGMQLLKMVTCLRLKRMEAITSAIIRFLQQDENDAIGMDEWNLLNGLSGTIVLEAKKLRNPKMRKMHIDQLYKNVVKGNKKVFKKAIKVWNKQDRHQWLKEVVNNNSGGKTIDFGTFFNWSEKKIETKVKTEADITKLHDGFCSNVNEPGKMPKWTMVFSKFFHCVFRAINLNAIHERWKTITERVIDTIIEELHKKLKKVLTDADPQFPIQSIETLIKEYLRKQGRKLLTVAAKKMLQAKVGSSGKLYKLLKDECYKQFKADFLLKRDTISQLKGQPHTVFIKALEANAQKFAKKADKWIGKILTDYWKKCVAMTQDKIIFQSSGDNKSKFGMQACIQIWRKFMATVSASDEKKQIIKEELEKLRERMKGPKKQLEMFSEDTKSESQRSGRLLEGKLLCLRLAEDIMTTYRANDADDDGTITRTPGKLRQQILNSTYEKDVSDLVAKFEKLATNTVVAAPRNYMWESKMSRFRKKRISKITGKLFSVLSGLKNRTTQNEKEEKCANDIRNAVLYFLRYQFYDQRGDKNAKDFQKLFKMKFEEWYDKVSSDQGRSVQIQNCVPFLLGYATIFKINVDIWFTEPRLDDHIQNIRVTPYPCTKNSFEANKSLKLTWDQKDGFCVIRDKKDKNQIGHVTIASVTSARTFYYQQPFDKFDKDTVDLPIVEKYQKKFGLYTGIKTLPAVPDRDQNSNGNRQEIKISGNLNVLDKRGRPYLSDNDGIFMYSSNNNQQQILLVASVHPDRIVFTGDINLNCSASDLRIRKICKKYLKYYQNLEQERLGAMLNRFKHEDFKAATEKNAHEELEAMHTTVYRHENFESENKKDECESLYRVCSFENKWKQPFLSKNDTRYCMEYSRENSLHEIVIVEKAHTIGYAKILLDGWMPVKHQPNVYINHKYEGLSCNLNHFNKWRHQRRKLLKNPSELKKLKTHQPCRCIKLLCKQCTLDHSYLMTESIKYLVKHQKRVPRKRPAPSSSSTENRKRQRTPGGFPTTQGSGSSSNSGGNSKNNIMNNSSGATGYMMMPMNNNTNNSNNNSSASFHNGNNINRQENNGMEVDSDGEK